MTGPVVGITTKPKELDSSFGVQPSHVLPATYTDAVREAGGLPLALPCADPGDVDALLDRLDAVVLSGGGDMDPTSHGRGPSDVVYGVVGARDRFELRVVEAARDRGMPLLAICRGIQVLNVALGGDLVLDIPTEVGEAVVHRIGEQGVVASHPVTVDPDSELARHLGATDVEVSSSHHQAIRRLAGGLRATAWAADEVIEAVEPADGGWPVLGVQWHPEERPPDNASAHAPFEVLVDAAGRWAAG